MLLRTQGAATGDGLARAACLRELRLLYGRAGAGRMKMPETKPRYTVELTTEGWQIKDNATGQIKADVYSDKLSANVACEAFEEIESKIDAAKGQRRR